MSKIQATFERLQAQGRTALIPFITAGDPDPALTVTLMHTLVEAGADIIELGVPFSDPMADGPTIQRASDRALKKGVSLKRVLDMVANFRGDDNETPVVLMGYANPIEAMGLERFAAAAFDAGVDGVLVVDYPPEEAAEFAHAMSANALDPIFLLAPTSTAERIAQVAALASGYVYYVSIKGVTGSAALDVDAVAARIPEIHAATGVPEDPRDLEISPNLWAGVGLVRGGAGTVLVGSHREVADRIEEYHEIGFREFILSGYPHLEEAWRVGEGLLVELRRRQLIGPAPSTGSDKVFTFR